MEFLKEFENSITDCLLVDPLVLARDLLQHGLISPESRIADVLGLNESHPQQYRYLLLNVHQVLQAGGYDSALFERYLKVLSKHSVPRELLEQMSRQYSIIESNFQTPDLATQVKGVAEELSVAGKSSQMVGGMKRVCEHQQSVFFEEKHVNVLAEILAKNSSKWNEIAISLNIPDNFIQYVKGTMHYNSPEVCLQMILNGWVSRQHQNAKPPTLEVLKQLSVAIWLN